MTHRRGRRGAVEPYRLVVATLLLSVLLVALSWLQGRFDSSDHQKATDIVRKYKATESGPTITQALVARHPHIQAHDISWSSEIMSSCLGHVRVHGHVPGQGKQPPTVYDFDVDLTDPSIHPTDPRTIEVLKALTATTTRK